MKIAVCIKQVPDTETRIRVAADGKGIVESDVNWIVSPYDEFAIEEALKIREAKGGEVVLVSLGPDRVQSSLRSGLAMGADSALHLKDPLFDQTDTLGTAWALATALKPRAPDLILMGQQGVGGDNAQVPGLVAEILDLPQVTLPAVVSAQKGLNEPRYASLKGIMAAKKKLIETKGAADLGLTADQLAPKTRVVALELPPARSAVKMIEGDADTQVKELLRLLHEEAKVI
jgi:electron transfer flavoprotein beta subunit